MVEITLQKIIVLNIFFCLHRRVIQLRYVPLTLLHFSMFIYVTLHQLLHAISFSYDLLRQINFSRLQYRVKKINIIDLKPNFGLRCNSSEIQFH